MSDSFSTFNLHSLTTPAPPELIPFCICTHCTNLISVNHHLGDEGGSGSRGMQSQRQTQQSSRWSPTPAQLLVLEELYRQGTKTPTAEEIQQIASQLRRFGKIEGKNVFYWFQNHKARERQKRRRREMEEATSASASAERKVSYLSMGGSEERQHAAGLRGTGYEVKETKKWASTSSCRKPAEQPVSLLETAESGPNRWTKLEERRLQILQNTTTISTSTSASEHRTICTYCDDEEYANTRTLELFPLKRDFSLNESKSKFCASNFPGTEITSTQFFEFLPLKTEGN